MARTKQTHKGKRARPKELGKFDELLEKAATDVLARDGKKWTKALSELVEVLQSTVDEFDTSPESRDKLAGLIAQRTADERRRAGNPLEPGEVSEAPPASSHQQGINMDALLASFDIVRPNAAEDEGEDELEELDAFAPLAGEQVNGAQVLNYLRHLTAEHNNVVRELKSVRKRLKSCEDKLASGDVAKSLKADLRTTRASLKRLIKDDNLALIKQFIFLDSIAGGEGRKAEYWIKILVDEAGLDGEMLKRLGSELMKAVEKVVNDSRVALTLEVSAVLQVIYNIEETCPLLPNDPKSKPPTRAESNAELAKSKRGRQGTSAEQQAEYHEQQVEHWEGQCERLKDWKGTLAHLEPPDHLNAHLKTLAEATARIFGPHEETCDWTAFCYVYNCFMKWYVGRNLQNWKPLGAYLQVCNVSKTFQQVDQVKRIIEDALETAREDLKAELESENESGSHSADGGKNVESDDEDDDDNDD